MALEPPERMAMRAAEDELTFLCRECDRAAARAFYLSDARLRKSVPRVNALIPNALAYDQHPVCCGGATPTLSA
jgi:hypothetical protein